MKKTLRILLFLGSSWLCLSPMMLHAQGAAGGAGTSAQDLEQLRRLQTLADQQARRARSAQSSAATPSATLPSQRARRGSGAPQRRRGRRPAGRRPMASPMDTQKIVDQMSFDKVMRDIFPLTPEQIVALRKKYNSVELAKTVTSQTPPRPAATSQFVNLSPGSNPPIIRLSKGFVTSLVFLDSSGAPWPIAAYDVGDPKTFNIQWDRTSNLMLIQATKQYNYGNIAVRLRGLNTPVMITLIPGQKAVDYRVDMRVQGYGPKAVLPRGDVLPVSEHKELLALLDGVPPRDSKEHDVMGGNAHVWTRGKTLFLRTRYQLISPGWMGTLRSADGMHVYKMGRTPLILVTQHGKIVRLKIEGL